MVEHTYAKCGKKFKRSDAYKKHLNRKNPCLPKKTNTLMEIKFKHMENEIGELKELIIHLSKDIKVLTNQKLI